MKILMIVFVRNREGTYYRAYPWARYLVTQGHHVTLAAVSHEHIFRPMRYSEQGVEVLETPNLFDGRVVMNRLSGQYGWGPLDIGTKTREVLRGCYDIVHLFEHHMNVALPGYAALLATNSVVVSDACDHFGAGGFREAQYSPYRFGRLYRWAGTPLRSLMDRIEHDLRRRSAGVTVISRYLRDRMISFGVDPSRIRLIRGGADTESIQAENSALCRGMIGIDTSRTPVLTFLGEGQFDVDIVLDALPSVRARYPGVMLMIIGKERAELSRQIDARGLRPFVFQTGWVADSQLSTYLGAADLFLMPLRPDPVNFARWPNKMGCYMAAARPVVATEVGDAAEVIRTHRVGICASPNARGMADAILNLLSRPNEISVIGQRARSVAEQHFDLRTQGSDLQTFYRELLRNRSARSRLRFTQTA